MANTHSLDLELSSSQYAYVADSASLSITGDITVEAWIKLEQLPSTAGTDFTIVGKYYFTDNKRSYHFYIDDSGDKLIFKYSSDGTNATEINSDAAAFTAGDVGSWVHIACAVDVSAQSASMYKDTVSVANTASGSEAAIEDNTSRFSIGAVDSENSATNLLDGKIDDVRIWNDIRSSGEISANYKREMQGNEAGLAAYWKLNGAYTDSTSNSNDLTSSGSPVFSSGDPAFDDLGGSVLYSLI